MQKGFSKITIILIIVIIVIIGVSFYFLIKYQKNIEPENISNNQQINNEISIPEIKDAQRVVDLDGLKAAVQLYLALAKKPFTNCIIKKIYSSDKGTNAVDGTGWLPLDFTKISGGSPFSELPIDPQNAEGFVYKFACDPKSFNFEFNAKLESGEYKKLTSDDEGTYKVGTDLNLIY